jgi:hypothetical protein
MESQVSTNLEEKGRHIYQTNENFRRLANVMEHPEFREFFKLYMQDWESTKVIVMFMKMYEALEKHSKVELTPYQKLSIVKDVIDDSEMRQKVCQGISEWTKIKVPASLTFYEEEGIVGAPS